ncbi:hypothetical protein COU76_03210 [Candidatus Peregrinibacteria bacterium CG10_big_fil_rev_8_21_14_0_10_49_10]|nr:MAG: hypothetical protein COU76_03210 [Candidatus Peregrinibacteria bacterium CG10_big_fil_rev_8_21_14_0_10_49_10]
MRSLLFSFALLSILALSACSGATPSTQTDAPENMPMPESMSAIALKETSHDFGLIQQSGGKVSYDFAFTYSGKTPITITGTPTSCACTEAHTDKKTLLPGESGVLTVIFNPNLHAEPKDRFYKTAIILSDPPLPEQPEVRIWAEIDLDLGPKAFELQEDHSHTGNEPKDHSH